MVEDFSAAEFVVRRLGNCQHPSPIERALFVDDSEGVSVHCLRSQIQERAAADALRFFEIAGPRERIYFDPPNTTCAIVTCGGLCPGINDVVRAVTMQLGRAYGVKKILGLRYGYRGLVESYGLEPIELTGEVVNTIHRDGGTFLRSSRGKQSPSDMVDFLRKRAIAVLFVIGGDGTMAGAGVIYDEIAAQGLDIGVVGIPKTIDNDIAIIQKTFGFETAVAEGVRAINGGHTEAVEFPDGVTIVRLMGRDAGFIAATATIASGDVNFCLVPEVPFALDGTGGLYNQLQKRLEERGHALIVVAEGAGKELREGSGYDDVGLFLKDRIREEFARRHVPVTLKYIDPSYMIRSVPATADDSVFCAQLGHHAVHAAMSGRTSMLVGYYNDHFVHIPFRMIRGRRKSLDPAGKLWSAVLQSTGQPAKMA